MKIYDSKKNLIEIGSRVNDDGVVTAISDPDGDVDDYGRSICIPPYVSVQYPDCADRYSCYLYWRDEEWHCDDVEVVEVPTIKFTDLPPVQ